MPNENTVEQDHDLDLCGCDDCANGADCFKECGFPKQCEGCKDRLAEEMESPSYGALEARKEWVEGLCCD